MENTERAKGKRIEIGVDPEIYEGIRVQVLDTDKKIVESFKLGWDSHVECIRAVQAANHRGVSTITLETSAGIAAQYGGFDCDQSAVKWGEFNA